MNRAMFLFVLVVKNRAIRNYILNAGTCEVDNSFEHPDSKFYLSGRFICILTRWEHVKTGSPVCIEAKQDHFPG